MLPNPRKLPGRKRYFPSPGDIFRGCPQSLPRPAQLVREVRLHRRPFGGDDAVDAGVAQRAVGHDRVTAQDTVEFGAEPLDALAALVIEEVRAELDCDAIQRLEGVGE